MESSFIPNSNPAIGRISTPWSAQLRKLNECGRGLSAPIRRALISIRRWTPRSQKLSEFGVRSLPRRSAAKAGSAFSPQSVIRNPQSKIRRVKGAWWPSRSSKPLLIPHPRGQGRFDSYPLRPNRKLRSLGVEKLRREISTSSIEYPAFGRTNVRNGLLAFTSNLNHQTSNFPKGGE
jgi:hypothetical protein